MTLGSRLPDPQMLGLTQLPNEREQLHKLCSTPPWSTLRLPCEMTATESFSNTRSAAERNEALSIVTTPML